MYERLMALSKLARACSYLHPCHTKYLFTLPLRIKYNDTKWVTKNIAQRNWYRLLNNFKSHYFENFDRRWKLKKREAGKQNLYFPYISRKLLYPVISVSKLGETFLWFFSITLKTLKDSGWLARKGKALIRLKKKTLNIHDKNVFTNNILLFNYLFQYDKGFLLLLAQSGHLFLHTCVLPPTPTDSVSSIFSLILILRLRINLTSVPLFLFVAP